jgi:iron complex outermembrane receptor protein
MTYTHPINCRERRDYQSLMRRGLFILAIASSAIPVGSALAQEDETALEEVLVTGSIRGTMRNSIEIKRDANTIVDVISASEMGDLPDLSIAETLERITGVTGDRFKGNSSEISVRGLGPFLGYSTYNGREISSGSGNRAVAFSQFPSELVNGAVVYKAQKADLAEGGVAGLIDLRSLRPIDFGERRFQAEIKANYNEYDAKLNGDNGLGYRGSVSYTDVFDTAIGTLGVAIGYAGHDSSTPEESYNTSSSLRNCNSDYLVDDGGSNCDWSDDNAAANGGAAADGDYFFVPNAFYFRQMESEENRDAVMATIQWQPNDEWDVVLDGQWSDRFYYEDRHDFYFDDGRRKISNWETNDAHALTSYTGESRLSTYGEFRERDEVYTGAGLNVEWAPTDRLSLNADLSYSDTNRYQETWQTRFRSDRYWYDFNAIGIEGASYPAVERIYTDIDDPAGSSIDYAILDDFSIYDANQRARYGEFEIEDNIVALALEGEYAFNESIISSVKAGVRFSEHGHNNYSEDRIEFTDDVNADVMTIADQCATPYPQSDYGDDANSSITHWATYETLCAFDLMVGDERWALSPQDPSSADVDLTEEVTTAFVMASFETQWGAVPVNGNFGVRVVNTDVTSVGYRQSFLVTQNDAGTPGDPLDDTIIINEDADTLTQESFTNSYVNVLPSINVNFGLTDDIQLRTAIYSAISRPDMWWMGAGRDLDLGGEEGEEFPSVEAAVANGSVTAMGNPNMEAIESLNYDLSVGWYPGDDTALSAALYYKEFKAGMGVADDVRETFIINGEAVTMDVNGLIENTGDSSGITGIELTVKHGFTSLPEPFDGLGVSAGYNYADTNFEYAENGSDITDNLVIAPSDLPGFSKESYNMETYWEKYGTTVRLSYKFRSDYLKPFGSNFGQTNRFVEDTKSLDLSLGYDITSNLQVKLQALNLMNDAYTEYRVIEGGYNRIEFAGRKYFLGLRYRM